MNEWMKECFNGMVLNMNSEPSRASISIQQMWTNGSFSLYLIDIMLMYFWWKFQFDRWNQLICKGFTHLVWLFCIPNASLLLGSYESWTTLLLNPTLLKDESLWSYITTREGRFSPHSYGKKWKSLWRLLLKRFLVKISQNLPPPVWHNTQSRPHTGANALFGLGLRN